MWPSFGSSVVCRRLQGQRGGDPVYHRGLECSRADFPGQGCSVSTGSNREGRSNVSPTKWPEPGFRTGPHPSPSWELVMAPRAWGEEVFMFVPSVKGRGPPVYPLFIQNLLGSWEKGAGGGGDGGGLGEEDLCLQPGKQPGCLTLSAKSSAEKLRGEFAGQFPQRDSIYRASLAMKTIQSQQEWERRHTPCFAGMISPKTLYYFLQETKAQP